MPPVVIAAGIATAGAVGSAVVSSKASKKAAKTTAAGNDAAIASQERGRAEAAAALAPWQNAGLQANSVLQDALGFNQPAPQPNAMAQFAPQGMIYEGMDGPLAGYGRETIAGDVPYSAMGWDQFQDATSGMSADQLRAETAALRAGNAGSQPPKQARAQSAFDSFLNSINYNWQLGQGQRALNSGYAGAGTLQSGAAVKAFGDYNQNMARGAYQDWYGSVENMANRGYGAAAAQAGVSTNTANNVSNLASANANALANIQIAKGNNTASLIGGIGQIGGYVAGNLLQPAPVTSGGYSRYGYGRN